MPFDTNGCGWLTVYVLAPVLGAVLGGGVYKGWLAPHYGHANVGEKIEGESDLGSRTGLDPTLGYAAPTVSEIKGPAAPAKTER